MSKNTNRDYIIIIDVKSSDILEADTLQFYINDNESHNIFVQLVIKDTREPINKYVSIDDPSKYVVRMNIVKPTNEHETLTSELVSVEDSLYQFVLPNSCVNNIGTYKCEVETCYNNRVTNSNKIRYKIKKSVLNDLDSVVKAPGYPIVIQLLDKLSDIEKYEEARRANELARQLAEEQRKTNYDELVADMTDSIEAIDNKVVDVENRITVKEQAVDTLITETKDDIYNYKVAKDQEINDYKLSKDTEINEAIARQDNKINDAITNQDNKIADAITSQNNRISVVENNDNVQNNRLDAIEIKNQQQDDRLLDIEKVNKRQDMDLKMLFAESKNNMIDITEEGNSVYLQNSTVGYTLIDEIQGNTLVNNNKEPDKELVLNGNINTQGYSNTTLTEGVDGGLVDVALEGNTLVNVCGQKDPVALPFKEELTYLYPSTQYAVQFVSDAVNKVDITLGGAKLLNQDVVLGTNKYMITTPSTLVDNKLVVSGVGLNIEKVVVTDTDRDFGYFEGMKSVGECEDLEVVSKNKNLFNKNNVTNSEIVTFNNVECVKVFDGSSFFEYYDNFKPNATYTFTIKAYRDEGYENNNVVIHFRYSDGTSEEKSVTANILTTIKSNPSKTLVGITGSWNWDKYYYIDLSATQLEEGSTATDYIPHAHNTQTLTHEPLRAVGDIKDKYVLIDGKWYIERNCGASVIKYSALTTNTFKGVVVEFKNKKSNSIPLCDSSKHVSSQAITPNTFYVNPINIVFVFDLNDSRSFEELINLVKTYNFVYELASPTYEPIDYNPFTVYSDVTHISNNSTIPCNMTIKNTGYNCLLKPNTTYTVSSNLGLNVVTTPSVLAEDCLRFYDTDTSDVTTMKDVTILEGDYTTNGKPLPSHFSGIESAFEQEYDEAVGKYKVKIRVRNEDATKENYIEFYIDEPLRGIGDIKDRVYVKNDKVVVERNCGQRAYQEGDFGTHLTDKVNTIYPLADPTYEEVEYNDTKLFIESFKNSTLFYNSNIPVTSKVWYSYSVPLVDTVAQTTDISDQQDQLIIDLATQCAIMEIMLM